MNPSAASKLQKSSTREITPDQIKNLQESFKNNTINKIALNAITNNEALKVGLNREVKINFPLTFSTEIKSGDITSQNKSGRCWMFAALNTLRLNAMEKMNLKTFELSQSYVMFWDKFERCNYHLENILETLDESIDSRLFMWLMKNPLGDGGQWDMFANLVKKYGVVPKEVYPESISSSSTNVMNQHLTEKLREFTGVLRKLYTEGKSLDELRAQKEEMLETLYRILVIHNGEPPTSFNWSWRDKDDKFHKADGSVTPHEFFDQYVDFKIDDYVSLIHCPTNDKPLDTHYTIDYLGNVVGGQPVSYLNVDMNILKEATRKTLESGEAVWFGCDVGKQLSREEGIIDTNTYNFDLLYSTTFEMDKAQRVDYCHAQMTHAMLFTGVHIEDEKSQRWKVENSWGKDAGKDGFLVMSDSWFDEHLFQVLVPKKFVPQEKIKILETKPTILKPWDPMGSLAS